MNKEQIDEIAFKVARESNLRLDNACRCSTCRERYDPPRIKAFTHALLAELAKVQEPVGFIAHNPGGCYEGSHIPAAPYNFAEFYGEMPTAGTKLYLNPLPQPDLVAEIERLKALNVELTAKCNWYNADGARLERERDYHLDNAKRVYVECTELRQQLSAAQASEDELLRALEEVQNWWNGELMPVRYPAKLVGGLLAPYKARKEASE